MEFGLMLSRQVECLRRVGSLGDLNGNEVTSNPLTPVLLAIILGDPDWFKILRVGFFCAVRGEGRKVVVVVIIVVPAGTVPSPCLNDAPRIMAIIDLMPKIDHGSVMKVGIGWSLALRPCFVLVARLASGLLYFLFNVATHGLVAYVALTIVGPPVSGASSRGATNLHGVTIALRPRGQVPSGRHWMLPIELHECTLG
jgi:hypothetical protein